jgi:TAG lipase/steryl ester hydrolase/phospholipase A2/LPA acyltransferase
MEEILARFEQGDLRPQEADYHRPRTSRRRPTPTRADREALREQRAHSDQVKKGVAQKKPAARRKKSTSSNNKTKEKGPKKGEGGSQMAA